MENMNQAIQRVKQIQSDIEEKKRELSQAIKEAEKKKASVLQEKEKYTKAGEISKVVKCKTEAEAYEERIQYLQNELENMSAEDLAEEIEELQAFARKYAQDKIDDTGDIYYKAWVEGLESEEEASKAISSANWILNETDKLLNRKPSFNRIFPNQFAGMMEATRNDIKYVGAWNSFTRRRYGKYLK